MELYMIHFKAIFVPSDSLLYASIITLYNIMGKCLKTAENALYGFICMNIGIKYNPWWYICNCNQLHKKMIKNHLRIDLNQGYDTFSIKSRKKVV